MTAPTDIYNAPSGVIFYAGKAAPGPAWAAAAPLNAWMEIPSTVSPSAPITESYSGMATTPSGRIIVPLSGGHGDGQGNPVHGIDLAQDAPAWSILCAASPTVTIEQPYYPDGKPAARHTYQTPQYLPQLNRIVLAGCYSTPTSSGSSFPTMDGFNLATNTWDAAGTYTYPANPGPYPGPTGGVYPGNGNNPLSPGYAGGMYSSAMVDGNGELWANGGTVRYNTTSQTWSSAGVVTTGVANFPRSPWAFDSARNQAFGLCYGDGQGTTLFLGIVAVKRTSTGVMSNVTFNSSSALTQFAAEIPQYAGMAYDPINDQYLFYAGNGSAAGRIYAIKPNGTNVWDMAILATTGTPPPATSGSGIHNRFQYIASLKGFVMIPCSGRGVFFRRTA